MVGSRERAVGLIAVWSVLAAIWLLAAGVGAYGASLPTVTGESFSKVGSSSATVTALIGPEGAATSYVVEFGSTQAYGGSTPAIAVEGTSGTVSVTSQLTGLSPGSVYHLRVVARNALGATPGADETLTTFPASAGLPDGRVYEMVTPVENYDADVYAPAIDEIQKNSLFGIGAKVPFQVSADGSKVTYAGDPTPGGNGGSGGGVLANQYLAKRLENGWSQENISPPGHLHTYYEAFSSDLSVGILEPSLFPREASTLVPEAPQGGFHVLYEHNTNDRVDRALFAKIFSGISRFEFKSQFVGGSTDFRTVVFEGSGPLVEGAPEGDGIYRSVAGHLELINVLPGGGVESAAVAGRPNLTGEEGSPDFSGAVSENGSVVIWTGLESHGLYLSREGSATVQIDASRTGGVGGGGVFQTATSDGGAVYFTDDASANLTANTVPGSGSNLYMYDSTDGGLTDLTSVSDARVQATVGVSADGSYVYYVADGAITSGAPTGTCDAITYEEGQECALYVWHEGSTRFIASLTGEDGRAIPPFRINGGSGENGDWAPGLGHRTAQVTPSGTSLVFMSQRALASYSNGGLSEVYLYDFGSNRVSCVSCDPSGQALRQSSTFAGSFFAGVLPISWDESRAGRWMSADGDRVFFDSLVPLVPGDTNGLADVYEWERDGSGSCGVAAGCVFLLSGGKSNDNSYLVGSSVSGDDVFFVTTAQLTESDRNGAFDLYDARVGGVQPGSSLACSGTGCQGVPAAQPVFSTPASLTFEGVGNFPPPVVKKVVVKPPTRAQKLSKALKVCKGKRDRKARVKCEATARKRYGMKPKSKAKSKAKSGSVGARGPGLRSSFNVSFKSVSLKSAKAVR